MHKLIYVTGITGFIGRNLLYHLLKKYKKVINFTRNNTLQIYEKDKIEEIDLSKDFFVKNPSDRLINLATLYLPNPNSVLDLKNLIEANILFPAGVYNYLAHNENLKIINALSYHQLLSFKAQNVYSLSKELFKEFLGHQRTEIVSLYIFDTFGAGDTRNKVVDIFIKNVLTGNQITIPTNEVKINLADVQPVCKSFMKSIDLRDGSYSVKSPDTISLEDLVKMIMEISNKTAHLNRANSGPNYIDEIKSFPQNIFQEDSKYSLYGSLKARVKDIQNDL